MHQPAFNKHGEFFFSCLPLRFFPSRSGGTFPLNCHSISHLKLFWNRDNPCENCVFSFTSMIAKEMETRPPKLKRGRNEGVSTHRPYRPKHKERTKTLLLFSLFSLYLFWGNASTMYNKVTAPSNGELKLLWRKRRRAPYKEVVSLPDP